MPNPDTTTGSVEREAVVRNPQGIHLRPATQFAQAATQSGCSVVVHMGEATADGRSVLELALLGIGVGTRLRVTVDGPDSESVADALVAILEHEAPE
jgi:phosphocarrier protein